MTVWASVIFSNGVPENSVPIQANMIEAKNDLTRYQLIYALEETVLKFLCNHSTAVWRKKVAQPLLYIEMKGSWNMQVSSPHKARRFRDGSPESKTVHMSSRLEK
jgi:hypothetical protein